MSSECFQASIQLLLSQWQLLCWLQLLWMYINRQLPHREKPDTVLLWKNPEQYLHNWERLVFTESAVNSWIDYSCLETNYWDLGVPSLTCVNVSSSSEITTSTTLNSGCGSACGRVCSVWCWSPQTPASWCSISHGSQRKAFRHSSASFLSTMLLKRW